MTDTTDNDLIQAAERLSRYDWQDWTAQDIEDAEGIVRAFRRLAALPAVSPGVRVKPLVWQPDTTKGSYPDRMKAIMPCGSGDYSVAGSRKQDKWQWFRNGYFVDGHQLHTPMPLDAAKAAAQADYDARILSAIHVNEAQKREHDREDVLTSTPSDDAVKAREAALKDTVEVIALAAKEAREAAMKEAAKALHDWQDDLIESRMPETAITVGMAADVVLALLTKENRT